MVAWLATILASWPWFSRIVFWLARISRWFWITSSAMGGAPPQRAFQGAASPDRLRLQTGGENGQKDLALVLDNADRARVKCDTLPRFSGGAGRGGSRGEWGRGLCRPAGGSGTRRASQPLPLSGTPSRPRWAGPAAGRPGRPPGLASS